MGTVVGPRPRDAAGPGLDPGLCRFRSRSRSRSWSRSRSRPFSVVVMPDLCPVGDQDLPRKCTGPLRPVLGHDPVVYGPLEEPQLVEEEDEEEDTTQEEERETGETDRERERRRRMRMRKGEGDEEEGGGGG